MDGYEFTVSGIADLDGTIDQVVVLLSYSTTSPITGFETYKYMPIASAPVKNKGFAVYLPEYLLVKYVIDDHPHLAFHAYKDELL